MSCITHDHSFDGDKSVKGSGLHNGLPVVNSGRSACEWQARAIVWELGEYL